MSMRWGFVGTGRISHRFMAGMQQVDEAIPTAVYARNKEKGQAFADQYKIPLVFDSFDEFLACSEIDVVYNALTHPHHKSFTIKSLNAKKPVLCEKPMAPNVSQELEMIECARANDVFLMEAMWTRMFPVTRQVVQWIEEGRIGKIIAMNGVFCIKGPDNDNDRLYIPSEGGGTLLDIGIYLVAYAHLIFKKSPQEIVSLANISHFGTDDCTGTVFKYDAGEIVTLLTSFKTEGRDIVNIYGSEGMIEIFEDFWKPRSAKLTYRGGIIDFNCPNFIDGSVYGNNTSFVGDGYQYEIAHVNDCIRKGLKQSPFITHEQSIEIMTTCDKIRKLWGIVYPFEK